MADYSLKWDKSLTHTLIWVCRLLDDHIEQGDKKTVPLSFSLRFGLSELDR